MTGLEPRDRRENILLGLGCAIIGTWIVLILVQSIWPSHVVPPAVHAIVAILVPILFGGAAWSAKKRDV